MNIALRRALTVDDYVAWAATQAEGARTELINGQIVTMSPEQVTHNRVKGSVYLALRRAVADSGLEAEVFTDGVTIPIDTHTAYEPDASVRMGSPVSGREMTNFGSCDCGGNYFSQFQAHGHERQANSAISALIPFSTILSSIPTLGP